MSRLLNSMSELRNWLEEHRLLEDVESVTLTFKGRNMSYYASDCFRSELKAEMQPHQGGPVENSSPFCVREGWKLLGIPFKFEGFKK